MIDRVVRLVRAGKRVVYNRPRPYRVYGDRIETRPACIRNANNGVFDIFLFSFVHRVYFVVRKPGFVHQPVIGVHAKYGC